MIPERQIRASYTPTTIRVYQAYSDGIADAALKQGTFVSPPFSMTRMTWIKPSFLWMMYRAGWGSKDDGQRRILAIDITHDGFNWALANSCPSERPRDLDAEGWRRLKDASPVRIQWDPERDLHFAPLPHRTIQIGLSGEAVRLYVRDWIKAITDVTPLAHDIYSDVKAGALDSARSKLPVERAYEAVDQ
ncbi:DUF4291 domain-containing protein [Bradyrhizobium sp. HKCCYLS2038]|uniref:DUF4291 domain-containing protein n=1 Tax=unclassified Bradyrhizobium TaxID=2631580 RepID=UPI003EBAA11F